MGNENSQPKKIFEQLDRTKDGVLTLDDLLTVSKLPEVQCPFTHSPLLLFRFDDGEDGSLNPEEFEKWLRHLQAHQKKFDKQKRKDDKKKREGKDKKLSEKDKKKREKKKKKGDLSDDDVGDSPCWTTLDQEGASKLNWTRDTETPALLGQGSPKVKYLHEAMSAVLPLNSETEAFLSEDTKKFLNNLLRRSEGRKRYMTWLFRLADVDRDGDLGVKELELVLNALEKDGIDTKNLSFDKCDKHSVAQRLLDEYDTDKTGFLTKDEFMVLADLIMRYYEEGSQKRKQIGKYELKRKLGAGSSGVVRLAINSETGERRAIKIIKQGDVSDMSRVDVELKAMMMLDHPSIVKLYEVLESEDRVFFVMELCGGGSISNYADIKPLSEKVTRYFMPQLLRGVRYCHKKGVCHRDLKLENLLISNDGLLKITDFGHAGIYRKGWDLFATGLTGSLYHVSPEQIAGQCYSGEKIDIWAIGVILYRLLVGKPPFFSRNTQQFFNDIQSARYEVPENLSSEAQDLLRSIFQVDPDKRPSISKILKHPWFNGPTKSPALARFVLRLSKRFDDINVPWAQIRHIINTLNVHSYQANTTNQRHHLQMIKCVQPKKDLKFSVTLKRRTHKIRGVVTYVEFNLNEGEGWEFNEMVHKVVTAFRKWTTAFKQGHVSSVLSLAKSSEDEGTDEENDRSDDDEDAFEEEEDEQESATESSLSRSRGALPILVDVNHDRNTPSTPTSRSLEDLPALDNPPKASSKKRSVSMKSSQASGLPSLASSPALSWKKNSGVDLPPSKARKSSPDTSRSKKLVETQRKKGFYTENFAKVKRALLTELIKGVDSSSSSSSSSSDSEGSEEDEPDKPSKRNKRGQSKVSTTIEATDSGILQKEPSEKSKDKDKTREKERNNCSSKEQERAKDKDKDRDSIGKREKRTSNKAKETKLSSSKEGNEDKPPRARSPSLSPRSPRSPSPRSPRSLSSSPPSPLVLTRQAEQTASVTTMTTAMATVPPTISLASQHNKARRVSKAETKELSSGNNGDEDTGTLNSDTEGYADDELTDSEDKNDRARSPFRSVNNILQVTAVEKEKRKQRKKSSRDNEESGRPADLAGTEDPDREDSKTTRESSAEGSNSQRTSIEGTKVKSGKSRPNDDRRTLKKSRDSKEDVLEAKEKKTEERDKLGEKDKEKEKEKEKEKRKVEKGKKEEVDKDRKKEDKERDKEKERRKEPKNKEREKSSKEEDIEKRKIIEPSKSDEVLHHHDGNEADGEDSDWEEDKRRGEPGKSQTENTSSKPSAEPLLDINGIKDDSQLATDTTRNATLLESARATSLESSPGISATSAPAPAPAPALALGPALDPTVVAAVAFADPHHGITTSPVIAKSDSASEGDVKDQEEDEEEEQEEQEEEDEKEQEKHEEEAEENTTTKKKGVGSLEEKEEPEPESLSDNDTMKNY